MTGLSAQLMPQSWTRERLTVINLVRAGRMDLGHINDSKGLIVLDFAFYSWYTLK